MMYGLELLGLSSELLKLASAQSQNVYFSSLIFNKLFNLVAG
jgi:hypothetical protein